MRQQKQTARVARFNEKAGHRTGFLVDKKLNILRAVCAHRPTTRSSIGEKLRLPVMRLSNIRFLSA
jgi:hypothetical protein